MVEPDFFERTDGQRLAYHWSPPDDGRSAIVFCGGLNSSMAGEKALALEELALARGDGYLRFDYRGHGSSGGDFVEGSIGDWLDDVEQLLAALVLPTGAPMILVGSSMGGWIALLLAQKVPVAGIVTIAAACDFTEERITARLDNDQKAHLAEHGWFDRPSRYGEGPYRIGAKLLEDGRDHLLLRAPIRLKAVEGRDVPVRLVHGQADPDIDWRTSLRTLGQLSVADVRLVLIKDGDHRLSRPGDIQVIDEQIRSVLPVSAITA